MQQRGTLKTNWSPLQQNCLSLHPQDIALNHAHVMRAMTAFNEGRMKEGKADQGAFGSESKLSNRDSGHAEAEPAELQGGGILQFSGELAEQPRFIQPRSQPLTPTFRLCSCAVGRAECSRRLSTQTRKSSP